METSPTSRHGACVWFRGKIGRHLGFMAKYVKLLFPTVNPSITLIMLLVREERQHRKKNNVVDLIYDILQLTYQLMC